MWSCAAARAAAGAGDPWDRSNVRAPNPRPPANDSLGLRGAGRRRRRPRGPGPHPGAARRPAPAGRRRRRRARARGVSWTRSPRTPAAPTRATPSGSGGCPAARGGEPTRGWPASDPAFEVIYLLEATDEAATADGLRRRGSTTFCERRRRRHPGGGRRRRPVAGPRARRRRRLPAGGRDRGRPPVRHPHHPPGLAPAAPPSTPSRPRPRYPAVVPARRPRRRRRRPTATGLAELLERGRGARVCGPNADRPPSAAEFERAVAADPGRRGRAAAQRRRDHRRWPPPSPSGCPGRAPSVRVAAVPAKATVQGIAALAVARAGPALRRRRGRDDRRRGRRPRYGAIEVAADRGLDDGRGLPPRAGRSATSSTTSR